MQGRSIPLKIMSFNMKRNYLSIGRNSWKYRIQLIKEVIVANKPDIIGTQELTEAGLRDLKGLLPEYEYVGIGRNGGNKGEYTAIFYLKEKFVLEDYHTFWLSTTPDRPSIAWLAVFPRICTTCTLALASHPEQRLRVFNTHLDHMSYLARINGLKLITHMIHEYHHKSPAPVLLLGDFNATPGSKTIQSWARELSQNAEISLKNVYQAIYSLKSQAIGCSYHAYSGEVKGSPIDYIFVSEELSIHEVEICTEKINERFPSDHYPVVAQLEWAY